MLRDCLDQLSHHSHLWRCLQGSAESGTDMQLAGCRNPGTQVGLQATGVRQSGSDAPRGCEQARRPGHIFNRTMKSDSDEGECECNSRP